MTKHEIYHFESSNPGPHLLVFGAIHGDETCGALAIEQCAKWLREGWLALQSGQLTMVPVCNPEAFKQGKRFIEENLNRVFKRHAAPRSYEAQLAQDLTTLVDGCDYLLDLHSQGSAGTPFVFQDYEDDKTQAFARALGVETVIKGWPEMFAAEPELNGGDTVGYAHGQGKTAVLLECGQHKDPRAPGVSYMAIINSLAHLGMVNAPERVAEQRHYQQVRATQVVPMPAAGGHLIEQWKHLQPAKKGCALAVSNAGETIFAPYDCVIILPKYAAQPEQEWFYLGKHESSAAPVPAVKSIPLPRRKGEKRAL